MHAPDEGPVPPIAIAVAHHHLVRAVLQARLLHEHRPRRGCHRGGELKQVRGRPLQSDAVRSTASPHLRQVIIGVREYFGRESNSQVVEWLTKGLMAAWSPT
eukprot:417800-Pyramimonas_sp.AAC.1